MAGTTNIPLTTLAPGTYHFGPVGLADTDTTCDLFINRTVSGGFAIAPATTTAGIEVDQSDDGGTTWFPLVAASIAGGPLNDKIGNPSAQSSVGGRFQDGTGRQARATVIISGGTVAVSGTLVIQ